MIMPASRLSLLSDDLVLESDPMLVVDIDSLYEMEIHNCLELLQNILTMYEIS